MNKDIPNLTKPPSKKTIKKRIEFLNRINVIDFMADIYDWEYIGYDKPRKTLEYKQRIGMKDEYIMFMITICKDEKYNIETRLRHPKKGYKKLIRKDLDIEMVEQIFRNPRAHTGRGKYIR
jgi:hypothetical protein